MTGLLPQLVPGDHILDRVDRVLDLSWLRADGADLYCETTKHPGITGEVAVRLLRDVRGHTLPLAFTSDHGTIWPDVASN